MAIIVIFDILFLPLKIKNLYNSHYVTIDLLKKCSTAFIYLPTMFAEKGLCMTIFEKNPKGLGCAFFSKIVASGTPPSNLRERKENRSKISHKQTLGCCVKFLRLPFEKKRKRYGHRNRTV
jgi:hypothetical protein